jgi:hypothetical protein
LFTSAFLVVIGLLPFAAVFDVKDYELAADGSCQLPECYKVPHGGSTAFMLWNAILVILEALIGHLAVFQLIKAHVPKPLQTAMLVSLALPLSHWFTEPYVISNHFLQGGVGLPLLLPIVSSL